MNHVMISEDMVKKVNGNFKPARNDLHKLSIFTTCFTPNFINRFMIGNANVKHSKGLHKVTGFHKFVYKNIDQVNNSNERRERFLNKVTKIVGSK
ncbi:MAG: hypothetical protein KAH32_03315 [Chlamydiia bacterium]|nr:hypothetical protein [Chlamydiia bacterium]